jgi:hypothetical protein
MTTMASQLPKDEKRDSGKIQVGTATPGKSLSTGSMPARRKLEQSAKQHHKPLPYPLNVLSAEQNGTAVPVTKWRNVDGERIDDGRYAAFTRDVQQVQTKFRNSL